MTALTAVAATAENWPRFRGANGTGIAENSNIPIEWTQDDLAWTIERPGSGHSSPVVWEDTVYLTSTNEESGIFTLMTVHASDGKTVWKMIHNTHFDNSVLTPPERSDTILF